MRHSTTNADLQTQKKRALCPWKISIQIWLNLGGVWKAPVNSSLKTRQGIAEKWGWQKLVMRVREDYVEMSDFSKFKFILNRSNKLSLIVPIWNVLFRQSLYENMKRYCSTTSHAASTQNTMMFDESQANKLCMESFHHFKRRKCSKHQFVT